MTEACRIITDEFIEKHGENAIFDIHEDREEFALFIAAMNYLSSN
jgi:hypothetical protein